RVGGEPPPQRGPKCCRPPPASPRGPRVRFSPPPCRAARLLRYGKWLGPGLSLFPPQSLAVRLALDNVAPSLPSSYRSCLATPSDSAPGSRFGRPPRGVGHLSVSLSSASSGAHLPWQSLAHGPAASRPVAAGAVLRSPAGLSPRLAAPLVSTTSGSFDPSTALRLRSSP